MPRYVIMLLIDWHNKLYVSVIWVDNYSAYVQVLVGVTLGGPLSPALFKLYIYTLLVDTRHPGQGCCGRRQWVGCILYAYDAILTSTFITGLQTLLDYVITSLVNLS
jgi:hypothetical protein